MLHASDLHAVCLDNRVGFSVSALLTAHKTYVSLDDKRDLEHSSQTLRRVIRLLDVSLLLGSPTLEMATQGLLSQMEEVSLN